MKKIADYFKENCLNVVHLSAEYFPFFKRGGLGDMVDGLTSSLNSEKINNIVIIPYYSTINFVDTLKLLFADEILYQNEIYQYEIYGTVENERQTLMVKLKNSFELDQMYLESDDSYESEVNIYHFIFGKIASKLIKEHMQRCIIFTHDWHVAGVYPYIVGDEDIKSIHVIHNYHYQGEIYEDMFEELLESDNKKHILRLTRKYNYCSLSLIANDAAKKLITVSPTYAKELQSENPPHEFTEIFETKELVGILNGIDNQLWRPEKNENIAQSYSSSSLNLKLENKIWLINKYSLSCTVEDPIIVMLSRLSPQKGIDFFINTEEDDWNDEIDPKERLEKLLNMNYRIIVCGRPYDGLNGEIDAQFKELEESFKGRFKYFNTYSEERAHKLLAGSDLLLHPSKFEPCGLTQLYALAFGTIPIVRPVGGLRDTITCYLQDTENGNGFWLDENFDNETVFQLFNDIQTIFQEKSTWNQLVKRVMNEDHSWSKRVRPYQELLLMEW